MSTVMPDAVLAAADAAHTACGPGQPLDAYRDALAAELSRRAIPFESRVPVEFHFKDRPVDAYYLDFVIDGKMVVAVHAEVALTRVQQARLFSSLRESGYPDGLLLNFGPTGLTAESIRR